MTVPFIDIKRFEPGFLDSFLHKVAELSSSAKFIGGEEVANLEANLQSHVGVAHAVTCANGTDAIQLALRALGVERGDTVLVPDFTFWATFEAVVNVGADPVTVDTHFGDGGVDLNAFAQAIDELRPKAAIVAHLFGWASGQLEAVRQICAEKDIPLVEDGAQCFGTRFKGESIYQNALISTTSFYPAKVLGGAGDGGAVFTDDENLAARVRQLANHGRTSHYGYGLVGWNSRLDTIQAAFLNLSLEKIQSRIASRRKAAQHYEEQLQGLGIQVMRPAPDFYENGYCNVCVIEDSILKERLESNLRLQGIGFGNIYPSVMSEQTGAKQFAKRHFGGSEGKRLSRSVLNLPLFAYMSNDELDEVINSVKKAVNQ